MVHRRAQRLPVIIVIGFLAVSPTTGFSLSSDSRPVRVRVPVPAKAPAPALGFAGGRCLANKQPLTTLRALSVDEILRMDQPTAEALAGPFFGASLFPYLAFLYCLNLPSSSVDENSRSSTTASSPSCPAPVVVGFAACLVFVFLTIPAAIAAKLLYGVSLADSDWLHGSAESTLTVANLALVLSFRSAVLQRRKIKAQGQIITSTPQEQVVETETTKRFITIGCSIAVLTAVAPVATTFFSSGGRSLIPDVHAPYLGAFLDLPTSVLSSVGGIHEPPNGLTVATWIIHISSVVEFLVAMGFSWEWAALTGVSEYRGLSLALVPLHSSGITACVSHVFYNQIYMLVPLQAMLTCIGNTTAAYAAWRIARATPLPVHMSTAPSESLEHQLSTLEDIDGNSKNGASTPSLVGLEDLGELLSKDSNVFFVGKLLIGAAVASYIVKYGGMFLLPILELDTNPFAPELAIFCIVLPSILNAYKWYQRGLHEE